MAQAPAPAQPEDYIYQVMQWRQPTDVVYDLWSTTETAWRQKWATTDAAKKWIKARFDSDTHSQLTSICARAESLVRCSKAVLDLREFLLKRNDDFCLQTVQMKYAQCAALWKSAQESIIFTVSGTDKTEVIDFKSGVKPIPNFTPPAFLNGSEFNAIKTALYVATVSEERQQNVRRNNNNNDSVRNGGGGSLSSTGTSRSVGQAPPKKKARTAVRDTVNSPFGLPPHASEPQLHENAEQV